MSNKLIPLDTYQRIIECLHAHAPGDAQARDILHELGKLNWQSLVAVHGEMIAALSWGQFCQWGPGMVKVRIENSDLIQLGFIKVKAVADPMTSKLIWQCNFSREAIAAFPDGFLFKFSPPEPPPICYQKISPQRFEFIQNSSSNFIW